jgi:transposase InsO family protein
MAWDSLINRHYLVNLLLVHKALKQTLLAYSIEEQAIVHSDRGGQYTDKGFRMTLIDHKLRQSMNCPDTPYDNAFMPSRRSWVMLV